MATVYVVQESPDKNILAAEDYGKIVILMPPNKQIMFSPAPVVRSLREKLRNFGPDDFIMAMGDPAAIGIACTVAADINGGRFKILKWDRVNQRYYPVDIDIYPERRLQKDA